MRLDEPARDGEAESAATRQPAAAGIGSREAFEGMIAEVGREAGAVVDDPHHGTVLGRDLDRDRRTRLGRGGCALSMRLRITRVSDTGLAKTWTALPATSSSETPAAAAVGASDSTASSASSTRSIGTRSSSSVAGLESRQQCEVVDERPERVDVALHRAQVALRVGRDTVDQRLGRSLQRSERRAEVVSDVAEQRPPLVLHRDPLVLQEVEPIDELVDGTPDVAELVGSDAGDAYEAIAGRDPANGRLEVADVVAERLATTTAASSVANAAATARSARKTPRSPLRQHHQPRRDDGRCDRDHE